MSPVVNIPIQNIYYLLCYALNRLELRELLLEIDFGHGLELR